MNRTSEDYMRPALKATDATASEASQPAPEQPHFLRKVATGRYVSAYEDARFLVNAQALVTQGATHGLSASVIGLMGCEAVTQPKRAPAHTKGFKGVDLGAARALARSDMPVPVSTCPPWWLRHVTDDRPLRRQAVDGTERRRERKRPADYDDTTSALQAVMAHLACADDAVEHGQVVYAVTLRLDTEVEARLGKVGNIARSLSDALRRALAAVLNREPHMALGIEHDPRGRLHVHGTTSLSPHEVDAFCRAARAIAGPFRTGRHRQVELKPATDLAWTSYATKGFEHESRRQRRARATRRPGLKPPKRIKGRELAMTSATAASARRIYDELRHLIIEQGTRPKHPAGTGSRPVSRADATRGHAVKSLLTDDGARGTVLDNRAPLDGPSPVGSVGADSVPKAAPDASDTAPCSVAFDDASPSPQRESAQDATRNHRRR